MGLFLSQPNSDRCNSTLQVAFRRAIAVLPGRSELVSTGSVVRELCHRRRRLRVDVPPPSPPAGWCAAAGWMCSRHLRLVGAPPPPLAGWCAAAASRWASAPSPSPDGRVRHLLRLGSRPPHGITTERLVAIARDLGNFPRMKRRFLYPGENEEVCEGIDRGEISAGRNRTHLME
jgi:hypothetical protein